MKDTPVNTADLPDTRLLQQAVASEFALRPNLRSVVHQLLLQQLTEALRRRSSIFFIPGWCIRWPRTVLRLSSPAIGC